ncbi:hypothetical protein MAUB1S_08410 [Mycolicibacterium aubagnense]
MADPSCRHGGVSWRKRRLRYGWYDGPVLQIGPLWLLLSSFQALRAIPLIRGAVMQDYLQRIDSTWLAVDDRGVPAAFITAGCGPIPDAVLAHPTDVTDIEDLLHALLPERCEASLRVDVPNADSYLGLCRLGLHVYDWTDVHLSIARSQNAYELVAVPAVPLDIGQMPPELREVAWPLTEGQLTGARRIRVGAEAASRSPSPSR